MRSVAADPGSQAKSHELGGLLGVLAILIATGAALLIFAGPPHAPSRIPSWLEIQVTLQGSDAPLGAMGYLFAMAAWLVWLWIVGTLLLQLVMVAIERRSGAATWARHAKLALDRVTLPIVRRVAEAAIGSLLVATVVARPLPIAAAGPAPVSAAAVQPSGRLAATTGVATASAKDIDYIVQARDTLWTISARFYGTGIEYQRIKDANVGRKMPDGKTFQDAGSIWPGWVLRIPLPSTVVQESDGQAFYTVEDGDTLSGIAARLLGDENRGDELFQLNVGKVASCCRCKSERAVFGLNIA